jgi:hypothetical protein
MNNSSNQLTVNELQERKLKKQIISMLALSSSSFSLSSSSVSSNQQISSSSFFDSNSDSDLGVHKNAKNIKLNSCSTDSSQLNGVSDNQIHTAVSQTSEKNNKYIFILNAFVNGFAQLKLSASNIDYEYIIEVYWSNGTKTFVKRTYDDFFSFHQDLMLKFGPNLNDLITNKKNQDSKAISKNVLFKKNDFVIPVLPGKIFLNI